jgi:hypothetical protein
MDSHRLSAQPFRKFLAVAAVVSLLSLGVPSAQAVNVLLNPGFETDAVMGQEPLPFVSDWQAFNTGEKNTVSAPGNPVRTGVGALQLVGLGGFGVPLALQSFDAAEGQTWDLQAYLRVEEAFSAGTRALVKIVFRDLDAAMDLQPAAVNIGLADPDPNFPGVIPNPQVTSTTEVGQWHLLRAQGVAPANTDQVTFFAILVDQGPGTVYFDDFQAELVEEQPQPGDFDNDGDVDGMDLDTWQGAFGQTAFADADGDGDSDGADFLVWQRNVGAAPAPPVVAVPEPGSGVLAAGIAICLLASRRKRAS